mmetsp:Transcript_4801/g.11477  ORF Transcript_4801/g.11477 Transcript_4801/m.11477 type:complete len:392 (+) Transcript_4801:142-1317(+)|eukprot:CAMPEP_0173451276 /NCGR_PEP_ID=MMETSP1357-20121228/46458_1 /TAXON_ID=77926 /ORGANISM="Hemiselmis rufescens, Strain PCC563" /LENGTH=391 /DNA_ID=CAMNT_0014418025 /DNA_START=102 /DNA_END=1277 /DNA_ORIENTATION=+
MQSSGLLLLSVLATALRLGVGGNDVCSAKDSSGRCGKGQEVHEWLEMTDGLQSESRKLLFDMLVDEELYTMPMVVDAWKDGGIQGTAAYKSLKMGSKQAVKAAVAAWTPQAHAARKEEAEREAAARMSKGPGARELALEQGLFAVNLEEELRPHGDTPLVRAAREGRLDDVKLLLDAGADIMGRSKAGKTSLMVAAEHSHAEVLRHLLAVGSTDLVMAKCHYRGWTALMYASDGGGLTVVELLVGKGGQDLINAKDQKDWTALMWAAKKADLDVIGHLIEKGGSEVTLAKDWMHGWTALMLAAWRGEVGVVRRLVEEGGDQLLRAKDKDGWTSLMYASKYGHPEVAAYLADQGGPELLATRSTMGWTARGIAWWYWKWEVADSLRDLGGSY